MNNHHNYILLSCRVLILLSHRAFRYFLGLIIIHLHQSPFLCIIRFSVLVITNLVETGYSFIYVNNYHKMFHPFCKVWILLYHRSFDVFPGWILFEICSFLLHITQIWYLGDHKIVRKWIYLNKDEVLPQHFSTIL